MMGGCLRNQRFLWIWYDLVWIYIYIYMDDETLCGFMWIEMGLDSCLIISVDLYYGFKMVFDDL